MSSMSALKMLFDWEIQEIGKVDILIVPIGGKMTAGTRRTEVKTLQISMENLARYKGIVTMQYE